MIGPVRRKSTNTESLKPEMYRPDYTGQHRGANARDARDYLPVMWIDMSWVVHAAHPECNYTWCETNWCYLSVHVADTVPLGSVVTCMMCEGSRWRFKR